MKVRQIGTKQVTIDGRTYPVRVFSPLDSIRAAGRQAATDARMGFETRAQCMAEYTHAFGHSPLSEPHR